MEFFIGLLALVGSMILIGKYWRYIWRVAVIPVGLFAIFVGQIVHTNMKAYDAKHAAVAVEVPAAKPCIVDGQEQDIPPWLCKSSA